MPLDVILGHWTARLSNSSYASGYGSWREFLSDQHIWTASTFISEAPPQTTVPPTPPNSIMCTLSGTEIWVRLAQSKWEPNGSGENECVHIETDYGHHSYSLKTCNSTSKTVEGYIAMDGDHDVCKTTKLVESTWGEMAKEYHVDDFLCSGCVE